MRKRDPVLCEARAIMRQNARTFYLASMFLPKRCRDDVRIIYAYFRIVDDLADEAQGRPADELLRTLTSWEDALHGRRPCTEPLLARVLEVGQRYAIPPERFAMVIHGAMDDVRGAAIETRDDLIRYSVLVAGSVGRIMAAILGANEQEALAAATELGIAMQITNVLRDVGEDARRGRVYLPRAELQSAGCSLESLGRGSVTPELCAVMRSLAEDARTRYRIGERGVRYLDPSGRFAVLLASRLYAQILVKIERNEYDVLERRTSLSNFEKWRLALPIYAEHRKPGVRG